MCQPCPIDTVYNQQENRLRNIESAKNIEQCYLDLL